MRKLTLLLIGLVAFFAASAQNLQLHYDFVRASQTGGLYFTSTFEYFGLDNHGSTYLFIDMDYSSQQDGVRLLYWEVSRDQKIGKFPLQLHVEFTSGNVIVAPQGFPIGRSYIFGVSYPLSIGKMNLMGAFLYRDFEYTRKPNAQFTGVWSGNFLDGKITVDGFIDIWTEEKTLGSERTIKILTEPQFWYNALDYLSIGGEIEISRNFITIDNKLHFLPTIALKWNLK